MKKALYILSALLLGLVSCNKTEFESIKPKEVEPTGLVAVTMKVQIPQVELSAQTKADGQRSHLPDIQDMRVAVFGTSGYPQAYALAEPIVSATDETAGSYATTNHKDGTTTDIYYFKVLLPVYEGEAHVHIIANGPKTIKFVDENEDSIMTQMRSEAGIGAFWARVVMPDGILTQLDQNGIMQTDDEGNFIPSDGTAHLFEDLVLVRNFAEVKLLNEATNIKNISWTLVNVPKHGSVAPIAGWRDKLDADGKTIDEDNDGNPDQEAIYVDDYKSYVFNRDTWRMVKGAEEYDGFMFPDEDELDKSLPEEPAEGQHFKNRIEGIGAEYATSDFVYERPHPGSEKATCILMRAQFYNGQEWDTDYTYYRMDLTEESVGGYFPIYRNYMYQMKIHKVGNRGSKTIADAMLRDSGGNVSQSTEAKKLTDISDGESRLFVEYVEKNFTSGGKKGLWVQYVPDVNKDEDGDGYADVDNTNITVKIKTQGDALADGTPATLTPTSASSVDGYYFYEFNLNEQSETKDLVSVLQVKASNYTDVVPEGAEKSTLYRDVTLRVMKKMDMTLDLVPNYVQGQGSTTILKVTLPEGLPESMFPLELMIEDSNHSLYATGTDGNGNTITVPVKTDKSLIDGTTNSFYFIRTVASYDEYKANNVISTEFKTSKVPGATMVYVANEYFKTQSIELIQGIASPATFAKSAFTVNGNSASAVSPDQYITVDLTNVSRTGSDYDYFRMSNNTAYGTITVTPAAGVRVTKVVITYETATYGWTVYYGETNPTLSTGTYSFDDPIGTWTLSATSAATFRVSTNGNNAPRVTSIEVTYEEVE